MILKPIKELSLKLNEIIREDRSFPIFIHTDAAQAIGKIKVDVNDLQVDYLTIVGHKVFSYKNFG